MGVLGLVLSGVGQTALLAQDGEMLFSQMRCNLCHKPDKRGSGPSLQEIAKAYSGEQELLLKYLKGEAQPIIVPEKSKAMQPILDKVRGSSEADLRRLVEYMLKSR
jgi:cytochrome c